MTTSEGDPIRRERHVATSLISLATGEIVGKLIMLATLVWSARVIGVEAYGVLTFGMGLGALLATIPSLAPASRMIQLVGRKMTTLGVRLAALNVLRWAFTLPAMVAAAPFILLRPEAVDRWTIAFMVVATLLDNTAKVWLSACTALDRQSATAAVLVGQRFVTLLLVGAALLHAPSAATVAAAFAVGSLLANAAMAMVARRFGARADYRALRWQHLKEMLIAVPVIGGNAIATEALGRVDVILIGLLAGDAAVGMYGAAYRLMETALFVSWTLARSLTPDLVRARDSAELGPPVRLGVIVLVALYVPYGAALALRGNQLVALLFGEGYHVGAVMMLLSAAPLCFGIAHFAGVVIFARRPAPIVLIGTLAALAVNILLNLLLLPLLHAEAAALAKTVAFAVEAIIVGLAVLRVAQVRGATGGILAAVAATALACIPMLLSLPVLVALLLAATVYCVAWYLLVRRFDPTTAEWMKRVRG